jgi:hypothetical protein
VGTGEVNMTEPFVPTGREYDDGDLPAPKPKRREQPASDNSEAAQARRVRDFEMSVAPEVDRRRRGAQ